jgi:hypothetical protein
LPPAPLPALCSW